ncbi:hypothetical protein BKA65DRAFT_475313 [Rhexocercosporidium sp. MPI-PUGE-AT-0058]|nr:hypothetical protein BKA65DRAFT_475313 [Rhexocercosporidium sp. MPI-PUGE-AT-0058]
MGFIDHYQILRLALSASDTEIKQSYKKLSIAFHPDKNKSPEATATFQLIAESYSILKDKDKRAAYDAVRKEIMGNKQWTFPDETDSDGEPFKDAADIPLTDDPKRSRSQHGGSSNESFASSAVRPDGVPRPVHRRRPRPELRVGLYTIFESQGDAYSQDPRNSDPRMLKHPSNGRRLFKPMSFVPTQAAWNPRMFRMPAQTFRSWRATELKARDRRVAKWTRWADEILAQVELLRRSAMRQQISITRLDEDEERLIDAFRLQKAKSGTVFGDEEEFRQALHADGSFQTLIAEKVEASKKMNGLKTSIRMFMDDLQDHQDDYEEAEHKAMIAVANKALIALEKNEFISDKDPKDVEKSKHQWTKLKNIGYTNYQKYRQPADIQRICKVAWSHRLELVEDKANKMRVCRRCNRDMLYNTYKCGHCLTLMCSTCNDKVRHLQRYHAWLEEGRSDRLFGI